VLGVVVPGVVAPWVVEPGVVLPVPAPCVVVADGAPAGGVPAPPAGGVWAKTGAASSNAAAGRTSEMRDKIESPDEKAAPA